MRRNRQTGEKFGEIGRSIEKLNPRRVDMPDIVGAGGHVDETALILSIPRIVPRLRLTLQPLCHMRTQRLSAPTHSICR